MTPAAPSLAVPPVFDLERVLASIDSMAAQRPVAAQIVSLANSDETSANQLARLGADHLQGFGLSRPLTGAATADWFAVRKGSAR